MEHLIIHISGASGSGKTTLGNKLKEHFKSKIVVKDLDNLRDEHINKTYDTSKGWSVDEVDAWEINEAFAMVAMAPIHELGIDEAKVRAHLLETYNLEIGAGLGALAGKAWRIGLMGYGARSENVALCLKALEESLTE